MRNILVYLNVIQVIYNEERVKNGLPKLGRGFFHAIRLNPYNPLSYILIICVVVLGLILFGLVGFWEKVVLKNPFKWD